MRAVLGWLKPLRIVPIGSPEGKASVSIAEASVANNAAPQKVRQYFREVSERYKLPPLPAVVATALKMIRAPMWI